MLAASKSSVDQFAMIYHAQRACLSAVIYTLLEEHDESRYIYIYIYMTTSDTTQEGLRPRILRDDPGDG